MNAKQRVALTLGFLVATAMCLMIPWQTALGGDAGYAFLLSPPSDAAPMGGLASIAASRLLMQLLAVAAATGMAFVALGRWRG